MNGGRIGRGAWSSRTNSVLVQEQERCVDQSWKITFPRLKRRAFVGSAVCKKLDQSARLIRWKTGSKPVACRMTCIGFSASRLEGHLLCHGHWLPTEMLLKHAARQD